MSAGGESDKPATQNAGFVEGVHGQGRTALVVEDDADVRHVAASALESLAFRVKEAHNGEEAMQILERDADVALVFSDVNMPGTITGIELGHLVRQRWPDIEILLTSGYLGEEQDTDSFDVLQKPYRASELVERLRSFAARSSTRHGTTLVVEHSDGVDLAERIAASAIAG